jgi:hypothetical protein
MANLGYKVSDQTHAAAAACALAALFMQFSATANRRFWSGQSRLPEANYSVDTHDGPSALLSVVKPALEFDRALGAT